MSKRSSDPHRNKFNAAFWSEDVKPKRRKRQLVHASARETAKKIIRAELAEVHHGPDVDREDAWAHEVQLALDCHYYGPCAECLAAGDPDPNL